MHLRIKSVHRKVLKWTDDEVYVDIRVFPNWILKMKITKIVFYKFYRFCRILSLVILTMKITKNSPNSIDSVDSLKFNSIKLKFLTPNDRYKAGMLKAKVDDPETVQLIEGAAAGMVATINRHGPEAVQDWEVDELLDWTTSLNFDEYIVIHMITELDSKVLRIDQKNLLQQCGIRWIPFYNTVSKLNKIFLWKSI